MLTTFIQISCHYRRFILSSEIYMLKLIKLFLGTGKHYSLAPNCSRSCRQNPLAECHRSGGDLNCARQQNGNEGCRMENGRQLKIQSELERERNREWRQSERDGNREKTLHAREKGEKTERDRLSAEFYSGPRDHSALIPPRKIMADGHVCCSIFEFATIRVVSFVRFSSPPCLFVSSDLFVFSRT